MCPSTVLVVEDETTLRETVAESLARDGYRVVTAADGAEAIARARAERPDLIVLDLMLPELSGIEVCRIVRHESAVPILILTARDSELDKVVGLEVGADDYVTKPFSLRELQARVRALLRRATATGVATEVAVSPPPAAATRTGAIELGALRIDLAGHRILRDGVPVEVKPRVFELLACLLRHPDQVLSRDQLLQDVWGYDYLGESRTIDVHVRWLRMAIEEDPARPRLIQTVRGAGYVLRRPR